MLLSSAEVLGRQNSLVETVAGFLGKVFGTKTGGLVAKSQRMFTWLHSLIGVTNVDRLGSLGHAVQYTLGESGTVSEIRRGVLTTQTGPAQR